MKLFLKTVSNLHFDVLCYVNRNENIQFFRDRFGYSCLNSAVLGCRLNEACLVYIQVLKLIRSFHVSCHILLTAIKSEEEIYPRLKYMQIPQMASDTGA